MRQLRRLSQPIDQWLQRADTFQVTSTSTPTTLDGKDGGDNYTVTHTGLAATLNVSDTGPTGSDQLTDSSSSAGPETIGISDTQVTRSAVPPALSYSGLKQLTVNGTNGGDTINVTKTAAGTATIVNAGSGLDTFGAIDLTQIGEAGLTLHAGGNGEAPTSNTTTAGTVSVSGTAVQRPGNGAVNYDGLASLLINGSSGADTFQVTSTSTPTTLDGKDGGDNYTVTHTGLAATLNVSDTGPTGSDQLTDSSSSAGPETIGISDTQVTRSGGSAALSYSGLEQLTVNGTNGGDTINVTKTAAGTATIVNAGSGLDTFGAIDLTQIGAAGLTLHAGGNGEALTLNTTTAGTVSVSGTAVQHAGNGAVNYDGLASLLINGSSGPTPFRSPALPPRPPSTARTAAITTPSPTPAWPPRSTSPTPAPPAAINSPTVLHQPAPRPSVSPTPKSPAPAAAPHCLTAAWNNSPLTAPTAATRSTSPRRPQARPPLSTPAPVSTPSARSTSRRSARPG